MTYFGLQVTDEASPIPKGEEVSYDDDDLAARFIEGKWLFLRKDSTPY